MLITLRNKEHGEKQPQPFHRPLLILCFQFPVSFSISPFPVSCLRNRSIEPITQKEMKH